MVLMDLIASTGGLRAYQIGGRWFSPFLWVFFQTITDIHATSLRRYFLRARQKPEAESLHETFQKSQGRLRNTRSLWRNKELGGSWRDRIKIKAETSKLQMAKSLHIHERGIANLTLFPMAPFPLSANSQVNTWETQKWICICPANGPCFKISMNRWFERPGVVEITFSEQQIVATIVGHCS